MNYVFCTQQIYTTLMIISLLCFLIFVIKHLLMYKCGRVFFCHMLPLHILCRLLFWIIPGFYSSKFFDFISMIRNKENSELIGPSDFHQNIPKPFNKCIFLKMNRRKWTNYSPINQTFNKKQNSHNVVTFPQRNINIKTQAYLCNSVN